MNAHKQARRRCCPTAASGRRYRLAWFVTLLNDCQLLLGCPPPAADSRQQFNMSILVNISPSSSLGLSLSTYADCPVGGAVQEGSKTAKSLIGWYEFDVTNEDELAMLIRDDTQVPEA